jgi:hypothetical protein
MITRRHIPLCGPESKTVPGFTLRSAQSAIYLRAMPQPVTFQTTVGCFSDAPTGLNSHYALIPESIIRKTGETLPARFMVHIHDLSWHGAIMPMGNGAGYNLINKSKLKKLRVHEGDKISVRLEQETEEYGMPICEELVEVLNQDAEAGERFHALTPGKQRSIIYFIGKIKSSQLRIEKALFLLNNLKRLPRGKEPVGLIFGAKPR